MVQPADSRQFKLKLLSLKWTVWSQVNILRYSNGFIWTVILYKGREGYPVTEENTDERMKTDDMRTRRYSLPLIGN